MVSFHPSVSLMASPHAIGNSQSSTVRLETLSHFTRNRTRAAMAFRKRPVIAVFWVALYLTMELRCSGMIDLSHIQDVQGTLKLTIHKAKCRRVRQGTPREKVTGATWAGPLPSLIFLSFFLFCCFFFSFQRFSPDPITVTSGSAARRTVNRSEFHLTTPAHAPRWFLRPWSSFVISRCLSGTVSSSAVCW